MRNLSLLSLIYVEVSFHEQANGFKNIYIEVVEKTFVSIFKSGRIICHMIERAHLNFNHC